MLPRHDEPCNEARPPALGGRGKGADWLRSASGDEGWPNVPLCRRKPRGDLGAGTVVTVVSYRVNSRKTRATAELTASSRLCELAASSNSLFRAMRSVRAFCRKSCSS